MAEKPGKKRLDTLVAERRLAENTDKAQAIIMAGLVLVDGSLATKAGSLVKEDARISVKERSPYVGRGGIKLAGCLDYFKIDVQGLTAIDAGASTGGFTDCLLKKGARKVFAIDVGKGILDVKLRNDARVTVLEGRNIRHMRPEDLGEKADMAAIDMSFISLRLVLPVVKGLVKTGACVLALVKPQFEVEKDAVEKGGVVRDEARRNKAVEGILQFASSIGYSVSGSVESTIRGRKGNREFWAVLRT
ncbi:MAG: TlyA family RNA methyltransferase [Deltaproteobacteria bacterium]|nr:TlyA family RNA methyltransferase [Deltaproteobacteria bacterium]